MTDELDKTPVWGESGERTLASDRGPAEPADQPAGPPASVDLTAGSVLAGRYRVISRLGKGGMGEVYRAEDTKLELPVALKFLPTEFAADTERHALLFEEIKAARKISHPNVCRVYDLGEAEGTYFLSMEYIDGEDLKSLLHRIGRLPWAKSIELGRQICEGLAAAHEAGVLHRDLKPANLMIDGEGRARITDFGLATAAESAAAGMAGTPLYMAPELFSGRPASVASDIYALGLVLYELFTGRRVIDAASLSEATKLHQKGAPTPPSELRAGFDPGVEAMILGCLEKDPTARPASAAEVATAMVEGTGARLAEGARIATLLLSELVGRNAVVELSGDSAGAELFGKHDRIARDLAETHGGREIDKRDGFLLLFDRPWQAVLYALDYHRRLAELSRAEGAELAARVGIHLGEIVLRRTPQQDVERGAKPYEVEGLARPVAARLLSVAGSGQTLMTQAAFDLARRGAFGSAERTEKLQWLAHGSYEFEGAEEPIDLFEVGIEGLAPLAPPKSTKDATRVADEDTVLGWRPAPGLEIPHRSNWLVKDKLGEGAFGEVWLGEQQKTGEVRVFKFCYETERLQSLKREITVFRLLKEEIGLRADIARILDWNLEDAPYFVEFVHVEGGSLVDWAARRGGIAELPLAERLEIVAQVGTALAAAHSVGVLHKDIKPANVLMAEDTDGNSQAVLTDFGIGLVTDTERLAAKGFTVLGMTELELESGAGSTAGTQIYIAPELLAGKTPTIQADIYALGVMLYQVAVGELDRPLAQGWERHIEDEILREDIAACVEGNPSRRPGSAGELAERLRALEERRAARRTEKEAARAAEKALRRRKVLGTVAAVSSVFLVVVSFLAIQAIRARADAERRQVQAEKLIDFMMTDLHEGLDRIGRLDLLKDVAVTSLAHFESLDARDESPQALYQRGMTLQNIGDVLLDQGEADAARISQEAAIGLFEQAAQREPDVEQWREGLSLARIRLGNVLREQGETDSAMESYRAALAEARRLADARADDRDRRFALAEAHYRIAALERRVGDETAVIDQAGEALNLLKELTESNEADWREHLLLFDTHKLLSGTYRFKGQFDRALAEVESASAIADRMLTEDPGNAFWQRGLAWSYSETGLVRFLQSRFEDGLEPARKAIDAYRRLIVTDPTRVLWAQNLSFSLQLEGRLLSALGRPSEVVERYDEAAAILEKLVDSDPTRVQWLRQLADCHQIIGQLHQSQGRTTAAVESLRTAIERHLQVVAITGDDPGPRNVVAWNRVLLGDIHAQAEQMGQAREQWALAVGEIEPITAGSDSLQFLDTHAQALLRLNRIEAARPLVDKLLAMGHRDPGFLELVRRNRLGPEEP